MYGKRLDSFVFTYVKKILVKKFRYNGLLRPKWVAYNFLGLDKINPNSRKWQPRVAQYAKNSLKILRYVYVWFCSDFFYKSSILSFFLEPELCSKNYYSYKIHFDKNLNRLITDRLKFNLKAKLYKKQSGLCAVCDEPIRECELLACSLKIYTYSVQLLNVPNKLFKVLGNRILLHDKCYLALCKNKFF